METVKIGDKLRTLRQSKDLTTKQLADKVSVSQSYISRFENNKAIPDIDMLQKVLKALDSDLSEFFASDMNMPSDLVQLINTIKTLSPEARVKLNEFLNLMKNKTNI